MEPIAVLTGQVIGKAYNPHSDQPVVVTISIAQSRNNIILPFSSLDTAEKFADTVEIVRDQNGNQTGVKHIEGQRVVLVIFDQKEWDNDTADLAVLGPIMDRHHAAGAYNEAKAPYAPPTQEGAVVAPPTQEGAVVSKQEDQPPAS
jgi:hypothetical protein